MTRLALPLATALAIVTAAPVFAQPASRLGRAIEKSKPLQTPENEARRKAQIDAAANQRRVVDNPADRQLLRMPNGYYIIAPDKYRPDNWSPRIRLRNDFSGQGLAEGPNGFRNSHRHHDFLPGGYAPAYDYGYCGGGPAYYAGPDAFAEAYEQGRYDADHEYADFIAAQRAGRLLDANRVQLVAGLEQFHAGRYDRAAIEWVGASRRNEGDAASRIHAGHALFAVGRYDEAVKLLARGFELAPQLAESFYDVRTDYGNPLDFQDHLNQLKTFVTAHPNDASSVTLLGYVVAYTEGPAAANAILERADQLNPNDFFIAKLISISRMVTPLNGVEHSAPRRPLRKAPDQSRSAPVDPARMYAPGDDDNAPAAAPAKRKNPSAVREGNPVIRRVVYRTSQHD